MNALRICDIIIPGIFVTDTGDNYMDYMNDDGVKAPRWLVTVGKIIKWLFIAFVIFMLIWFGICGRLQKGTSRVKGYVFTEKAAEALEMNGSLTVYDLLAYNDVEKDRNLTEKLFFSDHVMLTEEPAQIQLMLRYNLMNETIRKCTDGADTPFVFVLKDDRGNSYRTCFALTDSKLIYGYYRIIFEDIDLSEAKKLSLYVYRNTGSDLPELLDISTVWYNDGPANGHELSGAEKKTADRVGELITITAPDRNNSEDN